MVLASILSKFVPVAVCCLSMLAVLVTLMLISSLCSFANGPLGWMLGADISAQCDFVRKVTNPVELGKAARELAVWNSGHHNICQELVVRRNRVNIDNVQSKKYPNLIAQLDESIKSCEMLQRGTDALLYHIGESAATQSGGLSAAIATNSDSGCLQAVVASTEMVIKSLGEVETHVSSS